jgi:putative NADH-flavin reductase
MWWKLLLLAWLAYAVGWNLILLRKPLRPAKTPPPAKLPPGPLRLLIIGATGGTGRELVQQALAQGHHVTAMVRTPAKVAMQHPNLRVLRGDVMDYNSIELAMLGQEAVLSALGHTHFFGPSRILSEGTRNVLKAMKSCSVRRFICLSSLGVGDAVGRGGLLGSLTLIPALLGFYFHDRVRQEELIAKSHSDWTIVRAAALTNGPANGRYRAGKRVATYLLYNFVSRANVADFMLKQLRDETYIREVVEVV